MEGLFLVLVAAMLFSHAWYLLGLYTEGRTMGLISGALALGIAATAGGSFATLMMPAFVEGGTPNPAVGAVQLYVILWAVYAAAVAAHGLWDFEERAIGFHSLFLAAASIVYLLLLPTGAFTEQQLPMAGALVLAAGAAVLGVLSAMVFFHLAIPFRQLRPVAGWFLLVGSVIVALLGLGVLFGIIGAMQA